MDTHATQPKHWTEENIRETDTKKGVYMDKLHFVCINNWKREGEHLTGSSLPPKQKSRNWQPLQKFYSLEFFSTRHGNQNGRSLECCSCSHCYLAVCHVLLQRLHPIFLVSPSRGVALLKHMFGLCLELSHTSFDKSVLWVFLNYLFLPVNLRDLWWFPWY